MPRFRITGMAAGAVRNVMSARAAVRSAARELTPATMTM
jgi:hypothetical protein